ncbi:MAG: beta-ketoacyl synthase N-terminal-like domain-containing protein, partial [Polyangiaceae bacterium]
MFDPTGFALPADHILALDPLFQWVLHGAREALRSHGVEGPLRTAGLVLGNLSFPSAGMSRFAERTWLDGQTLPSIDLSIVGEAGHAHNRFNSGLPAHLAAKALRLGAGAFALDAACASSLYAIKLACDRLHDRRADLMIAGAVNGADDLFIHVGFTALSALSKTGRSRPFHREADGLVPAEGAAFVVLKRLSDAIASNDRILGVIRGVGLSNDGRGRGLLAPAEEGQERALRAAYEMSGVSPNEISLLECHATGTPVGDATEIRSSSRVFTDAKGLPIGSLKSNLGHLITAAGCAALLKVLAAMEANLRPATLHADEEIDALNGSPFRLLKQPEAWTGPKRAGISAFGFGGNNAHLIVEAWEGQRLEAVSSVKRSPIAIVRVGARVSDGTSAHDLARAIFDGGTHDAATKGVDVSLEGLKFPPKDLSQTLPQQLMVLESAREAAAGLSLPRHRTSVLVGMACDPEISRYGARWRAAAWAEQLARRTQSEVDASWVAQARDGFLPVLESAGVVGTMPNIVANRINSQLDLAGPSFSVSAEEASGIVALDIAVRALRAGEIDAAVVAAVDASNEPVHKRALAELGRSTHTGDGAVTLVLKRLDDAKTSGDRVLAVIDDAGAPTLSMGDGDTDFDVTTVLGRPHAATGLLNVAGATLALHHAAFPKAGSPATPWLGDRVVEVAVDPLEADRSTIRLRADVEAKGWLDEPVPTFHVYSGADTESVLRALAEGRESSSGPARLVIVARDRDDLVQRINLATRALRSGGPIPDGISYSAAPMGGDVAFVYTGAAAAYPGMGRELVLAMPELVTSLGSRCRELSTLGPWIYGDRDALPPHPLEQLWASSFLSQIHTELSRDVLGIKPNAAIGYSSGESNALLAMGAWPDIDAMVRDTRESKLFATELTGDKLAAQRLWSRTEPDARSQGTWAAYSVSAPLDDVRAALQGETLAHLTIINSPTDAVIGGESSAVARVIERLGKERALALGYDMVAHCPEVAEARDLWWALHRRPTASVPGLRFYSGGASSAYTPSPESTADAITAQAIDTLDFTRVIERAYADGVRVFIEHGPRGMCSTWIRRILGDRPHLAVSLDQAGRSSLRHLVSSIASLLAAGVSVNTENLVARLSSLLPAARSAGPKLTLPAHMPHPTIPAYTAGAQRMAPAPTLPSVLDDVPARPLTTLAAEPAPAPVQMSHAPSEPQPLEQPVTR